MNSYIAIDLVITCSFCIAIRVFFTVLTYCPSTATFTVFTTLNITTMACNCTCHYTQIHSCHSLYVCLHDLGCTTFHCSCILLLLFLFHELSTEKYSYPIQLLKPYLVRVISIQFVQNFHRHFPNFTYPNVTNAISSFRLSNLYCECNRPPFCSFAPSNFFFWPFDSAIFVITKVLTVCSSLKIYTCNIAL